MLFYNLFYFTVSLIAIVCSFFRDNRKLFLVLIGSLMILILTFRGINVGSDTIT
jgi:cytochrome c biogenesis protein CcdA